MTDLHVILDQLAELDLVPLLMAVVLGGLVGFEREVHGRPAGLRTHMLVCLASTLLIYVSRHLPSAVLEGEAGQRIVLDPTRMAAGIVTGIGFLGAASVVRAGDIVRGVTTGACIWSVAALGIVVGYEAYGLAVAATGLFLVVLVVLDKGERWISPVLYRRLVVRLPSRELQPFVDSVSAMLQAEQIRVQEFTGRMPAGEGASELTFHVRCRNTLQAPKVLQAVSELEGVESAEWI